MRKVLQYLNEHQDGDVHTKAYHRHLNSHIEEKYGKHVTDFAIHWGYIKNIYYLILGLLCVKISIKFLQE